MPVVRLLARSKAPCLTNVRVRFYYRQYDCLCRWLRIHGARDGCYARIREHPQTGCGRRRRQSLAPAARGDRCVRRVRLSRARRLRAIADTAGVSFQLIAYYFGSKEELWVATVDYLVRALSRDRQGLGLHAVGQPARAVPQPPAPAVDGHAAAAAAAQDLRAGVPREQHALPQHHSARSSRTVLRDARRLPYFREVVRLGIVERFTAEEICLLWSPVCKANVVSTVLRRAHAGLPPGSPKAVEQQVDLVFAILTEKLRPTASAEPPPRAAG